MGSSGDRRALRGTIAAALLESLVSFVRPLEQLAALSVLTDLEQFPALDQKPLAHHEAPQVLAGEQRFAKFGKFRLTVAPFSPSCVSGLKSSTGASSKKLFC